MLNINTATAAQLLQLPGVTLQNANAAIAAVQAHGPFTSAAQFLQYAWLPNAAIAFLEFTMPNPPAPPFDSTLPTWAQPHARPTVFQGEASYTITKSGVYSGPITDLTINAPGQSVILFNMPHVRTINCANAADIVGLNVNVVNHDNPLIPADSAVAIWRFGRAIWENNSFTGLGILFSHFATTMPTLLQFRYNAFKNINGRIGYPNGGFKCAAMQIAGLHMPNILIEWNRVDNIRGQSSVEDNFSFMQAGGTAASPAIMRHCLVNGQYAYPVGVQSSGSCFMLSDPGALPIYHDGGYVQCYNCLALDGENQGFVMAGSHDISCHDNIAVKDGTGSPNGNVPIQAFNWDNKTPANIYGTNSNFANNQYWWLLHGRPVAPSIVGATSTNNTEVQMTQAAALATYEQSAIAAGVTFGPR